jgi:hypothetical protein
MTRAQFQASNRPVKEIKTDMHAWIGSAKG